MAKMTIGLSTASLDKLTGLGVITSGAAADDMEVDIFVLLNAGPAFLKNKPAKDFLSEGDGDVEDFKTGLEKTGTPHWKEFLEMAKDMTEMKIYVCSLAGKVAGGENKEDFIELVDEICGIGEYIESVQEADVNLFL